MDNTKKIYVAMIGGATMNSIDALLLSLEKFKNTLSSDSAKTQFETTIRSIQPSMAAVDAFIDKVYAEKNPNLSVTMTARTLIVELALTKEEFLNFIHSEAIQKILLYIIAVGTMPIKKLPNQSMRDYVVFPVKYESGKFKKL